MYDFTRLIVDSVGGVTHALRVAEYIDRGRQFYLTLGASCFRYHPVLILIQRRHAGCVQVARLVARAIEHDAYGGERAEAGQVGRWGSCGRTVSLPCTFKRLGV